MKITFGYGKEGVFEICYSDDVKQHNILSVKLHTISPGSVKPKPEENSLV